MNSLVIKSRCSLLASRCQKLLILFLSLFYCSSQAITDSVICDVVKVSLFELDLIDSLSAELLEVNGIIDSFYYLDDSTAAQCTLKDFRNQFGFSNWTSEIDNNDGSIDTSNLPYKISISGAWHSTINNYRRYVNKLQIISPTNGYVSFDWKSFGGDFPHIDAFFFTINDTCRQLSYKYVTEGHFTSWLVQKGDTISLEQTSNGSSNFITTAISNFNFIPDVYQQINRTWYFLNQDSDTTLCRQIIEIMRPNLDLFRAPLDIGSQIRPALSCDKDRTPAETGYPYYKGINDSFYLSENTIHPYSISYTDHAYESCGGNQSILRKWNISDNCSGASVLKTQIIKTQDTTGIQMTCPKNQSFLIQKCLVSVYIRKPQAWTACTNDVDVEIEWVYGKGSRVYSNVTPGRYEIKFTANDRCGQTKICTMWLELNYDDFSQVECKSEVTYRLPPSGVLKLDAKEFIDYPNSCTPLEFEINGSKSVSFSCSDVGSTYYEISYYNSINPTSIGRCTTKINIESPVINLICPDDRYIDCSTDISDLSIFGSPSASGLNPEDYDYLEIYEIDDCGLGSIYRNWTIESGCEQIQSCTQTIYIEENTSELEVLWPQDYTSSICISIDDLQPNLLNANHGYPRINEVAACGSFISTFEDEVHGDPETGCFSILRNWKILNSCTGDLIEEYSQLLTSEDITPPDLTVPSNHIVYTDYPSCNSAFVDLNTAYAWDCHGIVSISNNSSYATYPGDDASGVYPVGITSITFVAQDGCENTITRTVKIEVRNKDDQPLRCLEELTIILKNGGETIGYWLHAHELAGLSESSCGSDDYKYAFSENIQDSILFISCEEVGSKRVNLFRMDTNENWESCEVNIIVTDPYSVCNPLASLVTVSGTITTESGEPINYVQVGISSGSETTTQEDGSYQLNEILTGTEYQIWPVKEINHRNGVNTLDMVTLNRFLLGIKSLESPYKIIACDINNNNEVSVGDLYLMNKLVLGVVTEMDKSWRFIDANYFFPDPENPFLEPLPELLNVLVDHDLNDIDFIGIKSGDPSTSADPQKLRESASQIPITFLVNLEPENEGSLINMTITPLDPKLVDGLQFTISFDNNEMDLINVIQVFNSQKHLVVNTEKIQDGHIGIAYLNYEMEQNIESIQLQFQAKNMTNIAKSIWFGDEIYEAEGYVDGQPVPLNFIIEERIKNPLTAFPNPFNNEISIEWNSDREYESELIISDIQGRVVKSKVLQIYKGENIYLLKKQDFENAGVYFLRVIDQAISDQIKIIMME